MLLRKKPTAIKKLEGNPGKRPLNENEPEFDTTIPKCPLWLTDTAKHEWKRVIKILSGPEGLITGMDMGIIAAYCQCYADLCQVNNQCKHKTGTNYPEFRQKKDLYVVLKGLCAELGGTPSARARLTLPNQKQNREEDPIEDAINEANRIVNNKHKESDAS